jgi:serine/threonine protein phosphatase 1
VIPAGTRVYAIGDIHGRLDLLRAIETRIADELARNRPERSVVVYLGDYVDRGPDSRAVIDRLLDTPVPADRVVHLLGNHEEAMRRFLVDRSIGSSWMGFGGLQTLASYGASPDPLLPPREWFEQAQAALAAALPDRHRAFLDRLALSHREGDYLFVHAGIRPGVAFDCQDPEDLIWIRHEFLDSALDHGCIVVHGHSISAVPQIRANRIGIDTGAFYSGRLTALVLEGTERRFLST